MVWGDIPPIFGTIHMLFNPLTPNLWANCPHLNLHPDPASGGELFDRIVEAGHFEESQAAIVWESPGDPGLNWMKGPQKVIRKKKRGDSEKSSPFELVSL